MTSRQRSRTPWTIGVDVGRQVGAPVVARVEMDDQAPAATTRSAPPRPTPRREPRGCRPSSAPSRSGRRRRRVGERCRAPRHRTRGHRSGGVGHPSDRMRACASPHAGRGTLTIVARLADGQRARAPPARHEVEAARVPVSGAPSSRGALGAVLPRSAPRTRGRAGRPPDAGRPAAACRWSTGRGAGCPTGVRPRPGPGGRRSIRTTGSTRETPLVVHHSRSSLLENIAYGRARRSSSRAFSRRGSTPPLTSAPGGALRASDDLRDVELTARSSRQRRVSVDDPARGHRSDHESAAV